jgi:cyclophilin family peptidyl-prolyl cis-trans isomerase
MAKRWSLVVLAVAVAATTAAIVAKATRAPGVPATGRDTLVAIDGRAPAPPAPVIVIETAKGAIEIELFPQDAPKSVDHILGLVRKDFFRGQRFYWVQPSVIQFGDPQTRNLALRPKWGQRGSGVRIGVGEFPKRSFVRGMVGLSHLSDEDAKYSDCQIFITKTASPILDGKYTMIGRVLKGMDVADKIETDDLIKVVSVKGGEPH